MDFSDLYNAAARWAGAEDETARAKDAVDWANRTLSYGDQHPVLLPWWRKREDTITPVDSTQKYALPTTNGTFDILHHLWYRTNGQRHDIELVDDQRWHEEANEDTTSTGTPDIANLYNDAGTIRLRFSPTPSSSFVSQATSIRLDGFIVETLTAASGDSVTPLMPDTRRPGIVWKAVEFLAARQGDTTLLAWSAAQGKKYYEMLLADDTRRTGMSAMLSRPLETVGDFGGRRAGFTDYGMQGR